MSICQIQVVVDDAQTATNIVDALLAKRMIACGQRLGPMVSRYWWKGHLQQAEEWLVLLKTRDELSEAVVRLVSQMHPYETPEVLALPVSGGNTAYLQWVKDEVVVE